MPASLYLWPTVGVEKKKSGHVVELLGKTNRQTGGASEKTGDPLRLSSNGV
jgi:hypothetical protein